MEVIKQKIIKLLLEYLKFLEKYTFVFLPIALERYHHTVCTLNIKLQQGDGYVHLSQRLEIGDNR